MQSEHRTPEIRKKGFARRQAGLTREVEHYRPNHHRRDPDGRAKLCPPKEPVTQKVSIGNDEERGEQNEAQTEDEWTAAAVPRPTPIARSPDHWHRKETECWPDAKDHTHALLTKTFSTQYFIQKAAIFAQHADQVGLCQSAYAILMIIVCSMAFQTYIH